MGNPQLNPPSPYKNPETVKVRIRLRPVLRAISIYLVLFAICGVLFIASVNTPPITITSAPGLAELINFYVSIELALLSGVCLLGIFDLLLEVAVAYNRHIRARRLIITCPTCTARNSADRYLHGQGCKECGSRLVYCEQCGQPAEFHNFYPGSGCPHCGARFFHTR